MVTYIKLNQFPIVMPKKRGYKEDTRGLKAKAQKAAAQAEKDARCQIY